MNTQIAQEKAKELTGENIDIDSLVDTLFDVGFAYKDQKKEQYQEPRSRPILGKDQY
ncbi:MAG: hypothetical protein JKX81_06380 [Arenicella sp.]|nr:hypothetical protein [Arenicella sp.]